MSLNPAGTSNYSWNYSKPDRDGFSLELFGTIVSLQEVQAREYNPNSAQPGRPAFWPDGNPKMNIRVGFATPDGSLKSITFQKAGRKQVSGEKPSLHMQLYNLAGGNMLGLMGKTVHMWTWPANPNNGVAWGQGNPRLFGVEEINPEKPFELAMPLPEEYKVPELYANDAVAGGQPVAPAPSQMHQPNVMPMNGGFYAAPTFQQPAYQTAQPTYQPAQPVYQTAQPMYQTAAPQPIATMAQSVPVPQEQLAATAASAVANPQPMTAPMPAGMDPAVAAAMQMAGATNVQPADAMGDVYPDVPF